MARSRRSTRASRPCLGTSRRTSRRVRSFVRSTTWTRRASSATESPRAPQTAERSVTPATTPPPRHSPPTCTTNSDSIPSKRPRGCLAPRRRPAHLRGAPERRRAAGKPRQGAAPRQPTRRRLAGGGRYTRRSRSLSGELLRTKPLRRRRPAYGDPGKRSRPRPEPLVVPDRQPDQDRGDRGRQGQRRQARP